MKNPINKEIKRRVNIAQHNFCDGFGNNRKRIAHTNKMNEFVEAVLLLENEHTHEDVGRVKELRDEVNNMRTPCLDYHDKHTIGIFNMMSSVFDDVLEAQDNPA